MSNDETNVERMRRALENQVRERLEKRISTRIQCDPPVAKVSDTIVVRADMMAPPTIAAQFKPVVRCVEVEGFGKRMLKRRGVRTGDEVSFEARFRGKELGIGSFRLLVYAFQEATDPIGYGSIQLFTRKEVVAARREVTRALLGRSHEITTVKASRRKKPGRIEAKPSHRRVPYRK